jgi:hypothetical protein
MGGKRGCGVVIVGQGGSGRVGYVGIESRVWVGRHLDWECAREEVEHALWRPISKYHSQNSARGHESDFSKYKAHVVDGPKMSSHTIHELIAVS